MSELFAPESFKKYIPKKIKREGPKGRDQQGKIIQPDFGKMNDEELACYYEILQASTLSQIQYRNIRQANVDEAEEYLNTHELSEEKKSIIKEFHIDFDQSFADAMPPEIKDKFAELYLYQEEFKRRGLKIPPTIQQLQDSGVDFGERIFELSQKLKNIKERKSR